MFYEAPIKYMEFVKCSPVRGIWFCWKRAGEKSEDWVHEGISGPCPSVIRDPVNGFQTGKGECVIAVSCHIFVCDITVEELKGFTDNSNFLKY